MKHALTIGIACLSLGLAGAATAQTTTMSHSHMAPNGSLHTTSRTEGPGGTATTRTVDRADGTRSVVHTRTDYHGDRVSVRHTSYNHGHHYGWTRGHHYGWRHTGYDRNRVCRTEWRHHQRVRRCWTTHHHDT